VKISSLDYDKFFGMLNFNPMPGKSALLYLICLNLIFSSCTHQPHTLIPLFEGEIPNSKPVMNQEISTIEPGNILIISKVSQPTLTLFLPPKEKANGAAVIICPGGGYINLAFGYEGTEVASRFNESGIAAFVLKYRIPDDSTMIHKEIGPLQDAQEAIRVVRSRAREWGIDPNRIGIMGFSAGGHLASTAGTHFEKATISNPENISLRPDFMILIYPVISFKKTIGHMGSAYHLLGEDPAADKIFEYSNEEQVTDLTPPAYLVHAKDDQTVLFENSTVFADSLKKHHVPVEVYLYDQGGHGFGMNNPTSKTQWMDLCIQWMDKEHFLK
jgi:acetyl esterase/lipase